MTTEEIEAVKSLEGSAGFRVIQGLIRQKLDILDRVSTLDVSSHRELESSALARKAAVTFLHEFLREINLLPVGEREARKTYE